MTVLQIIASLGLEQEGAGAKNVFCQSDPLRRPAGPIYCELCDGVPIPRGCFIELIAPVYGLSDAPIICHGTLTTLEAFTGFQKSP